MVLLNDWAAFALAATEMFKHSPNTTRLSMKYKRQIGELTLKLTDNVTCLKYSLSGVRELRTLERFCTMFIKWCNNPNTEDIDLGEQLNLIQPHSKAGSKMTDGKAGPNRKKKRSD